MQKRAIGVFATLLVVIPSIVLFGDSFRWIVERQVGILEGIFLAEAALLAAIIGVYLEADRDRGAALNRGQRYARVPSYGPAAARRPGLGLAES